MNAEVTILITCYKQEQYLKAAIESAEDQVIPYGLKGILPKFCVKYFIDEIGRGACEARNVAIQSLVHTPWCILLDADDMLPSHYLYYIWKEKIWNGDYSDNNIGFFYGAPEQFFAGIRRDRLFYGLYSGDSFEEHCPIGMTALFPLSAYYEIGGFDPNIKTMNDWDFWIRVCRAGYRYVHTNDTFVLRRGNLPGGITSNSMQSAEYAKKVVDVFNAKHSTKIDRYPHPYTIPVRS